MFLPKIPAAPGRHPGSSGQLRLAIALPLIALNSAGSITGITTMCAQIKHERADGGLESVTRSVNRSGVGVPSPVGGGEPLKC